MPDHAAHGYLTVVGTIDEEEGTVQLQPLFTKAEQTPGLRYEAAREKPVGVELLDARGEVVLRAHVPTVPICLEPPSREVSFFAGEIQAVADASALRVIQAERLLAEAKLFAEAPEVRLEWAPEVEVRARQKVAWEVRGEEGAQLMLLYSHTEGTDWQPLGMFSDERSVEIDFDELPGGRAVLRMLATYGGATSVVDSPPFDVAPTGCRALLGTPREDAVLSAEAPIVLSGQGVHYEERRPELEELEWSSSVDGSLGRGSLYVVHGIVVFGEEDRSTARGERGAL